MPNRPDFWGIEPEWIHFAIYGLLTLSFLIMAFKVFNQAKLWWKVGQPDKRSDNLLPRFGRLLNQVFVQQRILSQPFAGIMHILIAWSMFILFLGTPIGVINAYVFPGFLKGQVFLVFKLLMDICVSYISVTALSWPHTAAL